MIEMLKTLLAEHVTPAYGEFVSDIIALLGIALLSVIFYYITNGVLRLLERIISRTSTTWDDDLLNPAFLRAVSQLAPAIIVKWLLPQFFGNGSFRWLAVLTTLYIVGTVVWIFVILIRNLYEAFLKRPSLHAYAVKGVFQMVQLIMIGIAVIYSVSVIAGRSPATILAALGASAAVLMLVFKDTILGLVASVQLTANKMIHRGDWIVCDKHDANGEVIDISLTTVKVRNWDNSITTIPPYNLVSESFRNYAPMQRSGGRRVERAIIVDANSVRFIAADELA
ncbi:MAG: mechanosensitive ion channel family protein, partial [Muribaculaceae bacterium]|nr:mechanosensitive ion channel family protein [Muribaculaceae bacterium]